MDVEENKDQVRRYNEEIWKGNATVSEQLVAPDCIMQGIGGPREIRAVIAAMRRAFPDVALTVDRRGPGAGDESLTRDSRRRCARGR